MIFVAGCVETVPLGHECEDQSERCVPPDAPVSPPEAARPTTTRTPRDAGASAPPPVADAGEAPAPVSDAARPPPRAPELPLFPDLENRSFETLAAGSLSSRADARTAPWVACDLGWNVVERVFVRAASGGTEMVLPTEGDFFMEYVRPETSDPVAPLSQHLERPLESGKRYALRMDVQVSAAVGVMLEVWTGSRHEDDAASCEPRQRLGDTGVIEPGGWRPVCVNFEAPTSSSLQELMVVANFSEASSSNVRVFIDNLRQDPTCP
ncbi:MAG: hypothetical protein ABW252_23670 [Polyangiales bacterium]